MASSLEFVRYITEQLYKAGTITYRKMFGEYGIYCNGKLFALICDDCLFIKITPSARKNYPELKEHPPYAGAKPYFLISDPDNAEMLTALVTATCNELPYKKSKVSKKRPKRTD